MRGDLQSISNPVWLVEAIDLYVDFSLSTGFGSRRTTCVKAVSGVSLGVAVRETVGLVGESGCGKSTLGRTLMRLYQPTSGDVRFEGRSILNVRPAELRAIRRKMQMVFQDPYASLNPRHSVLHLLTEPLQVHGLLAGQREEAATALLAEVGLLPALLYRYPFELSGGQRERVSFARALSLRPSFLVLDEAVSSLDVSVQAHALNLLMDLRNEQGLSYLFISHDLGVVRHIADRVAVMYLGRIVETGRTDCVLESPSHPYTESLLQAVPAFGSAARPRQLLSGDPASPVDPPPGCPFHPRCPRARTICRQERPLLREINGRRVSCHLY